MRGHLRHPPFVLIPLCLTLLVGCGNSTAPAPGRVIRLKFHPSESHGPQVSKMLDLPPACAHWALTPVMYCDPAVPAKGPGRVRASVIVRGRSVRAASQGGLVQTASGTLMTRGDRASLHGDLTAGAEIVVGAITHDCRRASFTRFRLSHPATAATLTIGEQSGDPRARLSSSAGNDYSPTVVVITTYPVAVAKSWCAGRP